MDRCALGVLGRRVSERPPYRFARPVSGAAEPGAVGAPPFSAAPPLQVSELEDQFVFRSRRGGHTCRNDAGSGRPRAMSQWRSVVGTRTWHRSRRLGFLLSLHFSASCVCATLNRAAHGSSCEPHGVCWQVAGQCRVLPSCTWGPIFGGWAIQVQTRIRLRTPVENKFNSRIPPCVLSRSPLGCAAPPAVSVSPSCLRLIMRIIETHDCRGHHFRYRGFKCWGSSSVNRICVSETAPHFPRPFGQ